MRISSAGRLRLTLAIATGTIGLSPLAQAQNYDEGVAPTRPSRDAESGQFEAPPVRAAPSISEGQPPPWNPNASSQFACDLATDQAKGKIMDAVGNLPSGGEVQFTDTFLLGPLQAAAQVPGSDGDEPLAGERAAAFVLALSQAGAQLVFPEIGLVVLGGQILLGGTTYTIESMVAGARDQQVEAILTGDYSGALGRFQNIGADTAFITFLRRRYPQVTAQTLGQYLRSPQELTAAVGQWEAHLRDVLMETNRRPDQQRTISNLVMPQLYRAWQLQRAQILLGEARRAMLRALKASLAQTGGRDMCQQVQAKPAPNAFRPPSLNAVSKAAPRPVPDPGFAWDTRITIHGIECFGGTHHPTKLYHFHLNGRFVGVDRKEYDRVRAAASAGGAPFCGAWEVRRETTTKGAGSGPDESLYRGSKQ